MTYCVGMLLAQGLVMIADTRTNAGVDNISSYRKLHMLADDEDRLVAVATAGNLSITQTTLGLLAEGVAIDPDDPTPRRVSEMPSMFRVAQLVGRALAITRGQMKEGLEADKVPSTASLLLGGRIGREPLKLFNIYSAGNFVECLPDQPFVQIGETKYGKPILDRALTYDTPLEEAVKVGLISFDSTIRSNLAVGRPLDLIVVPADPARRHLQRRIATNDAYFDDLSARWSMLLQEARDIIPDPPFMAGWLAGE
ncbi:peptidase [Sphingomonas quercus]|uniref:Peptidase n=1 Tax=Sphingomonas quercus TaxID=2842451 RepID=A0ABS6BLD9_9SPHN|nr:peptidase [Sphingomonas quercus]MBU3078442.1 peptidase [Sphingomonas quercus]